MKLARQLERRMEGLVEGLSAAVFRGRIHPVELADRLVRHIDREAGDANDITIPNTYSIRVNPAELPEAVDSHELNRELAVVVATTATDRGWRIGGPTSVTVTGNGSVGRGRVHIQGRNEPGPLPAWAQLIDAQGGRVYLLTDNRSRIGRAPGADVELSEPQASRRHATIFRRHGEVWLEDMDSANGTYLNDGAVTAGPAPIAAGDSIRFGPASFTFKML